MNKGDVSVKSLLTQLQEHESRLEVEPTVSTNFGGVAEFCENNRMNDFVPLVFRGLNAANTATTCIVPCQRAAFMTALYMPQHNAFAFMEVSFDDIISTPPHMDVITGHRREVEAEAKMAFCPTIDPDDHIALAHLFSAAKAEFENILRRFYPHTEPSGSSKIEWANKTVDHHYTSQAGFDVNAEYGPHVRKHFNDVRHLGITPGLIHSANQGVHPDRALGRLSLLGPLTRNLIAPASMLCGKSVPHAPQLVQDEPPHTPRRQSLFSQDSTPKFI